MEGIALAKANKQFNVAGGAIVALDPRDGAIRAMASFPTYKPSVYVGRIDPNKLAPLVNDAAAKAANFPGPQPCHAGCISTRLDVEARHCARCDAGASPLAVLIDPVHSHRGVRP